MELCRLLFVMFLVMHNDVACEEQNAGVCNADSCEEKLENKYTQQVTTSQGWNPRQYLSSYVFWLKPES